MGKLCSASVGKIGLVSCHLNSGRPLRSPAIYFFGHFHLRRTGTQPPRTPFLGTVFGGHKIPSFVTESHQSVPLSRFFFLFTFCGVLSSPWQQPPSVRKRLIRSCEMRNGSSLAAWIHCEFATCGNRQTSMTPCGVEPDAVDKEFAKEKGRFVLALALVLPKRSIKKGKTSNRNQLVTCLQYWIKFDVFRLTCQSCFAKVLADLKEKPDRDLFCMYTSASGLESSVPFPLPESFVWMSMPEKWKTQLDIHHKRDDKQHLTPVRPSQRSHPPLLTGRVITTRFVRRQQAHPSQIGP